MFNNKRKISFLSTDASYVARWVFLFLCLTSFSSFASFGVMDEYEEGYYGNAQTREFYEDIEGTEALGPRDRAFLNSVQATRITNRWYLRALVGHPKVKVSNLTNVSGGPLAYLVPETTSITDNLYQLLLAGGKVWQNWGFEGEILLSKPLNYSFNEGGLIAASGDLQIFALFFNVQYIIPRWFDWYPRRLQVHLDAGTGGAIKNSNTSTFTSLGLPLDTSSTRVITLTGQLGVGARYQLAANWLFDFYYRYFDLGKSKYGPNLGVQLQSDKLQVTGYFFGVTYQV